MRKQYGLTISDNSLLPAGWSEEKTLIGVESPEPTMLVCLDLYEKENPREKKEFRKEGEVDEMEDWEKELRRKGEALRTNNREQPDGV